jgi:hypothetical protein
MNKYFEQIRPYLTSTDNMIFETKNDYNITYDGHHVIGFQIDEDNPEDVDILYPAGRDDIASDVLDEETFQYLQLWKAIPFKFED